MTRRRMMLILDALERGEPYAFFGGKNRLEVVEPLVSRFGLSFPGLSTPQKSQGVKKSGGHLFSTKSRGVITPLTPRVRGVKTTLLTRSDSIQLDLGAGEKLGQKSYFLMIWHAFKVTEAGFPL